MEWVRVGSKPPTELVAARETLHHAAQLLALVGASYLPARADDGHTSMTWLDDAQALATQIVDAVRPFRVGLRMRDLTILFLEISGRDVAVLPLAQRTRSEAIAWLRARIGDAGRDPAAMHTSLHFSIAQDPTDAGAPFDARDTAPFEELSRWYANAHALLDARRLETAGASDVRCWPDHFDIATLVSLTSGPFRTVGLGMSPGDASYGEPYFYIGPSPRPTFAVEPLEVGHWHTTDWWGGALTASDIVRSPKAADQLALVSRFIDGACAALLATREEMRP